MGEKKPEKTGRKNRLILAELLKNRREEAIILYNRAIRIDPQMTEVYAYRGNSKFNLGRYEEALGESRQGEAGPGKPVTQGKRL